jgi:hypothetical protein
MIDIFYKSYSNDFEWLYYSLKSVKKYLTGYNKIVIVVPEKDKQLLDYQIINDLNCDVHFVNEYGNGYIYQQFIKMTAHKYCESKFILYSDSDLVFNTPIDLQNYIQDDRPEVLYTDYSKVGDAICWKEVTEKFIGKELQYEFMRRLPLIYHRSTIVNINEIYDIEDTIMNRFSDRFSEFNAIGAWIFYNDSNKYKLTNTDDWSYIPPIGRQFWSWGGLTDDVKKEIDLILGAD